MTKSEEIKRLEADMASNKELNEKFYKTVDRIAGEKTAQSDGELFAKAAQEFGYNITAADFERLDAEREEVNADELKQVAGGIMMQKICARRIISANVYIMTIQEPKTNTDIVHGA